MVKRRQIRNGVDKNLFKHVMKALNPGIIRVEHVVKMQSQEAKRLQFAIDRWLYNA